jgi:tRNA-binding protein
MHVGTIVEVKDFPEARKPAYQLTIDFEKLLELENFGTNYQTLPKADLLERQIVAVVNFPKNKLVSS